MRRLGRAEMVEGDVPSLDELVARIEAVGHDEVGRVIERVLTDATPTLAVVGPHTESDFTLTAPTCEPASTQYTWRDTQRRRFVRSSLIE